MVDIVRHKDAITRKAVPKDCVIGEDLGRDTLLKCCQGRGSKAATQLLANVKKRGARTGETSQENAYFESMRTGAQFLESMF